MNYIPNNYIPGHSMPYSVKYQIEAHVRAQTEQEALEEQRRQEEQQRKEQQRRQEEQQRRQEERRREEQQRKEAETVPLPDGEQATGRVQSEVQKIEKFVKNNPTKKRKKK
jgi:hypothetical protein